MTVAVSLESYWKSTTVMSSPDCFTDPAQLSLVGLHSGPINRRVCVGGVHRRRGL